MQVTLDTIFGELLEEYPETEEVLKDYLGAAYCLVCPGKMFDSIGNGAFIHGLSDEQAAEMVDDLQAVVDSYENGDEGALEQVHAERRAEGKSEIGAAAGPYTVPVTFPQTVQKGKLSNSAPHMHADGTVHDEAHDDVSEKHARAEGEAMTDYQQIDTSKVNIDHMFQAAMLDSWTAEEDEGDFFLDEED